LLEEGDLTRDKGGARKQGKTLRELWARELKNKGLGVLESE